MRAFFGIKVEDCLEDLIAVQKALKGKDPKANYTIANNIHLTLVFLGEIDHFQLKKIKALKETFSYPSFEARIKAVKNLRDMIVCEVQPTYELLELQKILSQKLMDRDFDFNKRPYYPHITISRRSRLIISSSLDLTLKVKEFFLFSSERINNVLYYKPVVTFPLS
mgnify:CR=1 FL=1|jgi:2'-5' RNA ligase